MREPWNATPHGIRYFVGAPDKFLTVETCKGVLVHIEGEARHPRRTTTVGIGTPPS